MNYLQLNDWSKLGTEELALAEFFGEGNYKTFKVLGRYVPVAKDGTGALPDMKVVQQMADDFENAPKAYCLDVGVLSTGETALIEVNDGFSIGKYDMPKDMYANVLITRWNELKEGVTK